MENAGYINEFHTFRDEVLQILPGAFLLALKIFGLNILDSEIYRAREYH